MKIYYEDNHIIVIYKPKGYLSQPGDKELPDMYNEIKNYLKIKYNKPGDAYLGIVHRLDLNTDGIMVYAKTSKASARLSKDITLNNFNKHYYAVVEGMLDNPDYVKLIHKLSKNEKEKKSYLDNQNGKESILSYKAIKNYQIGGTDVTLIEVALETGRFHQIRSQMSLIGHPLYGDIKYGSKNHVEYEKFPLTAYRLELIHPVSKEKMIFEMKEDELCY